MKSSSRVFMDKLEKQTNEEGITKVFWTAGETNSVRKGLIVPRGELGIARLMHNQHITAH